MGQAVPSQPREALAKALSYIEMALELLDEAGSPADIGAHLDLALCRLREALGDIVDQTSGPTQHRGIDEE
jgi:hypothetical protein